MTDLVAIEFPSEAKAEDCAFVDAANGGAVAGSMRNGAL
jgi:hypothetical protein